MNTERREEKEMSSITIKIPEWIDSICVTPVLLYRKLKYGHFFRKIPLGEGRFTIVEPCDFYRLNNFHWTITGDGEHIYAIRNVIKSGAKTTAMRLHREIMNSPKGLLVDHRNNDTLDNRRANLRVATHSQNNFNCRKRKNTSSRFIGVSFDKHKVVWTAYISFHRKRMWLGCFKTEFDAARAYDVAARMYHKEFARLNFPDQS
jgi:hypothetical protein